MNAKDQKTVFTHLKNLVASADSFEDLSSRQVGGKPLLESTQPDQFSGGRIRHEVLEAGGVETVRLYFKDGTAVDVTISFVNENGDPA